MSPDGTPETSLDDSESSLIQQADVSDTAPPASRSYSGLAATFRSLRHRNYRLYFFGQLVSLTGTWMQNAALVWLAFQLTDESKWAALVSAAQILPTFFFGAWGGALADRWPKRTLIFLTQSAFLLLALVLAALTFAGIVTPWQLLLVTALNGLVQAIDLPARLAFVMDLAGREDLMNAVALNSLLFNVARVIGPAISGFLMRWLAPEACFFANGLSYAAVLWALARMDIAGSSHGTQQSKGLRALLEGLLYLAGRRELAFLMLLVAITSLCGWPSQTLLPALTRRVLGSNEIGYSWMLSGTGIGALTAAWTLATFGSMEERRQLIRAGIGCVSTGLIALSIAPNLPLAMGCCGLIGFGLILFLATSQSIIQLSSGEHNRGRVMAIWAMTQSGAVPLGSFLAGVAADRWNVPLVLQLLGLSCALAASGLWIVFWFANPRPGEADERTS
jgi:MFS family permease